MNEIENRRTIEKIEETKSWLFEEIIKSITSNKTDRQKKREDKLSISWMKWVITADPADIKELIREYYK